MVRRLRLWAGLVLFAYVATHLANHALGLISLPAMEAGRIWFLALWRSTAGTVALYGAFAVHMALVLYALYARRQLRMPRWEAGQILLGLAIPPLLAEHVIGTRFLAEFYGVGDAYTYVVLILWVFAPVAGARQTLVLVIAWVHGCMGLHYWLRIRPWYPRAVPVLYAAALLLPVLAILGFFNAGQEVAALAADPEWLSLVTTGLPFPDAIAIEAAERAQTLVLAGFAALIAAVVVARLARSIRERRRGVFHVAYPGGRRVRAAPGATILEVSRGAGIPHASVCGGRGRCSTCRVRVGEGSENLPPASPKESRVLRRVGAPPKVRLACQTRPTRDVEVTPLLPPTAGPSASHPHPDYLQGSEQEIAILFADMRDFTRLAEKKLPYDVVFLLNRYFRSLGEAVEHAGGQVDKFIGDGVMALFGVASGPERGCREALAAARAIAEALDELNRNLANDLDAPLSVGIGIHAGPVIVGEMGYARATTLTAIGDAVNAASRLEALTKEYRCQLIVSEEVAERAGVDLSRFASHDIEIRGRRDRLAIRVVGDAHELPETRPAGTVRGAAARESRRH